MGVQQNKKDQENLKCKVEDSNKYDLKVYCIKQDFKEECKLEK